MKFNAEQLLFELFSHIVRIFGSIEPQTESSFPFLYIIIFQRIMQSFEPPSSTLREVDMCAHSLFCTEFNAEQLLFEVFPHIMWHLELHHFHLARKCTYSKANRRISYFALRKKDWRLKISEIILQQFY